MTEKKKTCFVIGPIGEPDSKIREWSDTLLEHIIKPAVVACGYDCPLRADDLRNPGMITHDIITHLFTDDLVIADLTNSNPNVYYELAVRHAAKKPVVTIIKQDESLPFDNKDLRTIPVDLPIHIANNAIRQIKEHIVAAEKLGEKAKNPITNSIMINLMQSSSNDQQQQLGNILSTLEGIRYDIDDLKKQTSLQSGIFAPPASKNKETSSPTVQFLSDLMDQHQKEARGRRRSSFLESET